MIHLRLGMHKATIDGDKCYISDGNEAAVWPMLKIGELAEWLSARSVLWQAQQRHKKAERERARRVAYKSRHSPKTAICGDYSA